MITSGINLAMAVVGFSLSIMFITFVCIRLICARIRVNASRRSGSDLSTLERGFRGLEPCALTKFPTKKYRDLCLSSKENSRCTVCLSDYHEEDTLRFLPVCGHSFHATCIDIWLQRHFTCPVCRVSLRDPPERKWFAQPMFCSAVRSQSASTHYCHCNVSGNRHTSTSHDNGRMDAIQEVEGDGDHERSIKTSGKRQVASPSELVEVVQTAA